MTMVDIIPPVSEEKPPVVVSLAKKQAPPEKPEAIRQRSWIILSFWAVVIFLGLPLWYRTTTIYRAKLPLGEMMDWAEGRVRIDPP